MLVYGDPWRTIDLAEWRERAAAPLPDGAGILQHGQLAARLIEGGQILQALEDAEFERNGFRDRDDDRFSPLRLYLLSLARALIRSFDRPSPCLEPIVPPALPDGAPDKVRAREPEGYSFYALYPEAYALAARRLRPSPDTLVIGLRSIGASLAPVVAAALGAPGFITLRPKGPPFAREIDAPDLAAALVASPARDVAIVDEGPGLSGSSFASVARLIRRLAPGARITFLPSHEGQPGAQANPETRALFASVPSLVAPFRGRLHADLPSWVEDLTGRACAPLEDISGGEWRRLAYATQADWPAIDASQERLKFLLHAKRGSFLLKFVGLGRIGERKARMAMALGAAGLAPEALGYRHGFLVERWRGDARPLDAWRDRAALLPALARYLAFRQQRFSFEEEAYGADPAELQRMAVRNTALALGDAAGALAGARLASLFEPSPHLRNIATDNRMHVHEWLMTPDGRVLKTDGVDHHAGHDLIGAQDVAYDIAAAAVEFSMSADETDELCNLVEHDTGQTVQRSLVAAYRIVWLAFEIGRASLAESGCAATTQAQLLAKRRHALTEKLKHELAPALGSQNPELQSGTLVWPA